MVNDGKKLAQKYQKNVEEAKAVMVELEKVKSEEKVNVSMGMLKGKSKEKNVSMNMMKVKSKEKNVSVNMMKVKSEEKETVKSKDVVMFDEKKSQNNYQQRAEEAEAALEELVGLIGTILNASYEELKKLCNKKEIKVVGKSAMKHKYACALLMQYVKK
jgi:hypothetical protein